jgi:hypothetical protein
MVQLRTYILDIYELLVMIYHLSSESGLHYCLHIYMTYELKFIKLIMFRSKFYLFFAYR